jgi:tetratricopeptide (TPR) repeat protein
MIRSVFLKAMLAGSLLLAGSASARAQIDRIRVRSERNAVQGTVDTIARNEITVSVPMAGTRTIPSSDVELVLFAGADTLQKAQLAATKGEFKEAADLLDGIRPNELNREIVRAELAYWKAFCLAKIALSGQVESDDSNEQTDLTAAAKQAGGKMREFLKEQPTTYHYYEANEIVGDLLMAVGLYDRAREYYSTLAESPSLDLKARADLLRGRAMQIEGKYDAALQAYDAVLRSGITGKLGEQELLDAKIGRTYSLASSGKVDEAVKLLKNIVANADDDDTELLARAYDALGNCYRKLKDNKQALWAYLRVDTLYGSIPESHAEALANLVVLWEDAKHPDRARDARDRLQQRYPFSRWNKQIR